MRTAKIVEWFWIMLALGATSLQTGCSSTYVVYETGADRSYLDQVQSEVGRGDFFIPAETRFASTLRSGTNLTTMPTSLTGGNTYNMPVYSVVREACEIAVKSAFREKPQAPRDFLQDQALEVIFGLREVHIEHDGGEGEAHCTLDVACEIRLPSPSTVVIDSFRIQVAEQAMLSDDGTGLAGPGPLWVAAGELTRRLAERLKSNDIRRNFSTDRNIAWRSSADGVPPPPGEVHRYDVRNSWGEYVPVVKLTDFGGR